MLSNAKESKRSQRNSEERTFGNKTDTKVFTRAAAAMPTAKNPFWREPCQHMDFLPDSDFLHQSN